MPYTVERSSECPDDRPYAVIKISDRTVMGCHPTAEAAGAQIGAIEREEEQ